ncbi:MAG: phosphoglucosamine mutase [Gammaproteobacteria bacterium]|nr:MAG: phosphoglucosamine mutase [Gammaproteobacteria bacterium]
MARKHFGTDGIRGGVGEGNITPDFMLRLGWACGRVFVRERQSRQLKGRCRVIIGKDTRVSGYMFESALEAGLVAAGVDVQLLGPMPTPAVALMTRSLQADAGIVISASHNPFYDNGIKFFSAEGAKLSDEVEMAIEQQLDEDLSCVMSRDIGKVNRVVDAAGRYIEYCKATVDEGFSLRGMNIVVDCANGATYHIAPSVFSELGADVIPVGVSPDGFNINQGVGSTDIGLLSRSVIDSGAELGIAFDGDGDRVAFVDNKGREVDGDELIYIIACAYQKQGRLTGVAGTSMTNLGIEKALQAKGIPFGRADVGDRYVKEMMVANDWNLGGESSGHIICSDVTTTGDGVVAALQVLQALRYLGVGLREALEDVSKYPQRTINVPAKTPKTDLSEYPELIEALAYANEGLADRGRVLLRPSGTESKVRVTVEGEDAELVEVVCRELADQVKRILD